MIKSLLLIPTFLLLTACKNKNRNIDVELTFKGSGNGDFTICFIEKGDVKEGLEKLGYHIYVTTKNGLKRDVERDHILQKCDNDNMCQYAKRAYSDREYEEMKTYFVPGNIQHIKVEIFYQGEYNNPFITKEFDNL